jgi:hypothetical protein
MFKQPVTFLILAWVLLVICLTALFYSATSRDHLAYEKLVNANDNKKGVCKARQQRFNVSKHLLMTKGEERVQLKLHSLSSDLMFDQKEEKTELVEHFKDLECTMQESFLGSQQIVRHLQAERAIYHYHTEELVAEKAKLARFMTQGNQIIPFLKPVKALMNGTAERVEFSIANSEKPLKVQGLRATFQEGSME